ncbi:MAG: EpsD family peptidyl-prolyl cis-trans isomerase [Burkholderiales bacterium]
MIKRSLTLSVAMAVLVLAGCDKEEKKDATQVIAKVGDAEVTVHQLNHALSRLQGIKPEQAELARQKLAKSLVDQQVLVNAAMADKLDRDPNVLMDIEGAKREILAKAYMARHLTAGKPTEGEVKAYYEQHPDLFAQRKVYDLLVIRLQNVDRDKLAEIGKRADAGASLVELQAFLSEQGFATSVASEQKGAEHLPLEALPKFAQLQARKVLVLSAGSNVALYEVVNSKAESVPVERAKPFIEAYLGNKSRAAQAEKLFADLKQKASIQYQGDFAKLAQTDAAKPAAAPAAAPAAKPATHDDAVSKGVEALR